MTETIRIIREAFASVPRPMRTMADAEVADDWGDASSRFVEHDSVWWEIPDELIAKFSTVLCYLSPEAELYYLPAYMTWSLKTVDTGSASTQHLISFLSDPSRLLPVWNLMTSDQKQAVLRFSKNCQKVAGDRYDRAEYEDMRQIIERMPNQPPARMR